MNGSVYIDYPVSGIVIELRPEPQVFRCGGCFKGEMTFISNDRNEEQICPVCGDKEYQECAAFYTELYS